MLNNITKPRTWCKLNAAYVIVTQKHNWLTIRIWFLWWWSPRLRWSPAKPRNPPRIWTGWALWWRILKMNKKRLIFFGLCQYGAYRFGGGREKSTSKISRRFSFERWRLFAERKRWKMNSVLKNVPHVCFYMKKRKGFELVSVAVFSFRCLCYGVGQIN